MPRRGAASSRLLVIALALLALGMGLLVACSTSAVDSARSGAYTWMAVLLSNEVAERSVQQGDEYTPQLAAGRVQGQAAPEHPTLPPPETVPPATIAEPTATATMAEPTAAATCTPEPTAAATATPLPQPTATLAPPPTEAPPAPAAPSVNLAGGPAGSPPDRITAASIGLDVPVVVMGWTLIDIGGTQATNWNVPNHAAGFHQGSAYPGQVGNTVISGHSNTAGRVFENLDKLALGDRILVYVGASAYEYQVTQRELLQEQGVSLEQRIQNGRWIAPTDDECLTLVTCWPNTGTSHRLIIVARPQG